MGFINHKNEIMRVWWMSHRGREEEGGSGSINSEMEDNSGRKHELIAGMSYRCAD